MRHAQVEQRDPVIPGERRIGEQRAETREKIPVRRNGLESRPNLSAERLAAEFLVEEIEGGDDGGDAQHRPEIVEQLLHAA